MKYTGNRQTSKSRIPNKQIEEMFMLVATPDQMSKYSEIESVATKTSYASGIAYRAFVENLTQVQFLEGLALINVNSTAR